MVFCYNLLSSVFIYVFWGCSNCPRFGQWKSLLTAPITFSSISINLCSLAQKRYFRLSLYFTCPRFELPFLQGAWLLSVESNIQKPRSGLQVNSLLGVIASWPFQFPFDLSCSFVWLDSVALWEYTLKKPSYRGKFRLFQDFAIINSTTMSNLTHTWLWVCSVALQRKFPW